MARVKVKGEMLRWARERARLPRHLLEHKFPKLDDWENGVADPTLKQLEAYAKATHAPVGYLFLPEPPAEPLPIPDFRTVGNVEIGAPSPDLLETIYICQERQAWYREFALANGESASRFVGSATLDSNIVEVAQTIRMTLHFDVDARRDCPTWTDALRMFIAQADAAGILVMCSGVVMNNNKRKLNPKEFRGFALADEIAPLVFVNGADTKAAQMFTLAHELAHLWLGRSALSDATVADTPANHAELWCNQVAAETLAPLAVVRASLRAGEPLRQTLDRLARQFKVSTLVALRRIFDAGAINRQELQHAYFQELERLDALMSQKSGGDFYLTTAARVSKRFARALISSTLEGRTLYRDAFRLLGISKAETFNELGRSLKFEV